MLSSDSTVPLLLAVLPPLSISLLCFAPLRPDRSALLPLPFSLTHPSRKHPLPLRLFLVLAALATWLWLVASAFSPHEPWQTALHIRQRPPDYRAWREAERALPQNNLALPPPQGSGGRYVRFSNHLRSTGWGRAMQEMVMNAHLALHSGRIFVMYGYDGDAMPGDYNVFSWGLVHTRVPISALLGGPIAGGAFPPSTPHPPAITSNFFRTVCPHPTKINVTSTLDALSLHGASAGDLLTRFASYLAQLNDNCVELVAGTGQVFDAALFEDAERAADVWPSVLSSPILTAWQWSPLVASGVAANLDQLHLPLPAHKSFDPHSFVPIPGLLALHIPRSSDFADHCDDRTQPAAFNAALVPRTPASRAPGNAQTCFPTLVEILRRVAQIRRRTSSSDSDSTAPGKLSRVYILTNASRGWLAGLTYALRSAGFDAVASSRDLKVSWEQTFVVGGMDMLLASRAEVFVGNAWSTVTADVNMLRAAHGYTPESSQFW